MTDQTTYPLRLPRSVKAEVQRRAKAEGTSVNQFVATAVAEKLAAMNTAEFFAIRRQRADFEAFDKLMRRKGGEEPREDDRVPDVNAEPRQSRILRKAAAKRRNVLRKLAE